MKKAFCVAMAALVAVSAVAAQPVAAKFGGMLEVDSTLWNSDGSASSAVIMAPSFEVNAGSFGVVLGFVPSATNIPAFLSGVLGDGYTESPLAVAPDSFYAWVKLLDGKARLVAGQINEGAFAPNVFVLGGQIVSKIATSDAGQGIELQASPIEGLLLAAYAPLSDGADAYAHLSAAAQYSLEGVGAFNAGYVGSNKGQTTADGDPAFAVFGTAQISAVDKLAAYAGYEYCNTLMSSGTALLGLSDVTVGAKYTGIDKVSIAFDGEFSFFDALADGTASGMQLAANGEYSIAGPYAAGLTAVYNQDASYGVNMSGAPWASANIGDDNCVMLNPYFAINPMGPPPFAKVTVGFAGFYQVADYDTYEAGGVHWAIPVAVTVIF